MGLEVKSNKVDTSSSFFVSENFLLVDKNSSIVAMFVSS